MKPIFDILAEIADRYLNIPTLQKRRSDSLDFHEVSVWGVTDALLAAYQAGLRAASAPEPLILLQDIALAMHDGGMRKPKDWLKRIDRTIAEAMAAPSPVAELLAALKGVLGESDYDAEGCCRGCGREREDEAYKYCAIDDDVEDCPFGFARAVIAKAGLAAAEHDHD